MDTAAHAARGKRAKVRLIMAEENEFIRTLIAARVRELGHRRDAAKALAKDYARGDSEYMRETFVKIQETIEATSARLRTKSSLRAKKRKRRGLWRLALARQLAAREAKGGGQSRHRSRSTGATKNTAPRADQKNWPPGPARVSCQAAWLALSVGALPAMGQGQKPECARGKA
jgi:hypothetical protein